MSSSPPGSGRYRFRFRSVWHLDAPQGAVYEVVERAEEYPAWWRQVREAHRSGADSGTLRIRSVLPYDLRITCRSVRADPAAGVLEAALGGDVAGWARWTVEPGPPSRTVAVYEQHVEVCRPLMRRLAVPCRPFFHANHALMMRAGERGLRRWLARRLADG